MWRTAANKPVSDGAAVPLAIALMIVSGFTASFLHLGVRYVAPSLPTIEIVLLRSVFTLLATLPFMLTATGTAWRTNNMPLQAARGVVGVCSMTAWYYALGAMPLGDAGALSFSTTIFVAIGAALWFGETVGPRRWAAIIVGLIGTTIIMRPGAGVVSWAAWAAVGSSVLWAVSLLMSKELARFDSTLTISFYQSLLTLPLAFVASVPSWVWPSLDVWLIMLGMGVAAAISNFCITHALRIADASATMPADYIRLLWMVGWGFLLFNEVPTAATWAGAALIIASTSFITWREARAARPKQDRSN